MKKQISILVILLLVACPASADLILLKNGEIIEGKIIDVRGIFVRVLDNYDTPFKEFLMEDIVNIEQTSPDPVSQMTIRNIHQRSLERAQGGKIQKAVDEQAVKMLEEAIQKSDVTNLDNAPEPVKFVAQEKASAIIGEAIKAAQPPRLDQVSLDVKTIAEEKAGSVIEEAVRTVEVFPLQMAPSRIQLAAQQAANTLVGEAAGKNSAGQVWNFFGFTVKDFVFGGLILILFYLLFQERKKKTDRPQEQVARKRHTESSMKVIDDELKKFDKKEIEPQPKSAPPEKEQSDVQESPSWDEKRMHRRFEWNFPISLSLEENNPVFAMVNNISCGGAFAVCNDVNLLRTMGDETEFKFNFKSKDPNFPIAGKTEVVRIRSNRGLGLRFFDLTPESLGYLDNLAANV